MSAYVRGVNPIWLMADLTGNLLDDTYYLFVLENIIPYLPETVYQDPDGSTPWSNPIQFLANGTLPDNIFYDPDKTYRLEVRQGNTQADPLIYEINNWIPGEGQAEPITTVATLTDNQITTAQFADVSFESPFTLTNVTNPDPIEVAPGWFLILTGTGNVTLQQTPLTSTQANPTNAPYALQLTLSGTWTGTPYLRQRFSENGNLWADKWVASSLTARSNTSPFNLSAVMYNSAGTPLATVLDSTLITTEWNEYTGSAQFPAASNTNTPPNASIEYRLLLPTTVDVFLTSFQLVASDLADVQPEYTQDSIDRQQDYTFHYYRESLLRQSKESILTGWDFGLNPWQFHSTATTNVATLGYVADQTIVIPQQYVDSATGNSVSTERDSAANNYGFVVTAVTAANQFALVQYIDPTTVRNLWGENLSAYVKLVAQKQNPNADLQVKMRLIYNDALPATLSQTEPFASWAANGEPVLSANWTYLEANNDPVYNLSNGENKLTFDSFTLPAATTANMTLGVVIYTLDSMDENSPADNISFRNVSLVHNDFAIEATSLTFDETLRRCQYYYENSYALGTAIGTSSTSANALVRFQPITPLDNAGSAVNRHLRASIFEFSYETIKRATPTISMYSPNNGTLNEVQVTISNGTSDSATTANVSFTTNWTAWAVNTKRASYTRQTNNNLATLNSTDGGLAGSVRFHYVADARLGV